MDERRSVESGDEDEQPEPRRDDDGDVEAGAHAQKDHGGRDGRAIAWAPRERGASMRSVQLHLRALRVVPDDAPCVAQHHEA